MVGLGLAIGTALARGGMAIAKKRKENKMQLEQQQKLQQQEIEGQKQMGEFNQGLAIDTWDKTNFEAQRKHMENAGLNVGLMYSGAGGGGGATTQAGNVTGGQADANIEPVAGLGIEEAIAIKQAQSNVKLQEAQARNLDADTAKKAGVDTQETKGRIELLANQTTNEALKGQILEYDKKLKEIETNVQGGTADERIKQVGLENDKLIAETKKLLAEGKITEGVADETIKQAKLTTAEQQLRMKAIEAGIDKTEMDTAVGKEMIEKMGAEIIRMKEDTALQKGALTNDQIRTEVAKKLQKFQTGDAGKTKQWVDIVTSIVNAVK